MQLHWCLLLFTVVKAEGNQYQCASTVSMIKPLMDRAYMGGAALIVVNASDIIYDQSIGFHSPLISNERQQIDTSSSIFLLASISKTFVSVAAMQMIEINRLHLDVDINQYLQPVMNVVHPHFPNFVITTRHLLTHTSGIKTNVMEELEHFSIGDRYVEANIAQVLKKYLNNAENWLPVPPGNKTSYSNVGINVVAFIIERLTGVSFEQYMHENVLKPLGITARMGGYRLSNFNEKKTNLVDHYLHTEPSSSIGQMFTNQLNASPVGS
jgi:CubicO group peptidase (beta-lactamase class C family)